MPLPVLPVDFCGFFAAISRSAGTHDPVVDREASRVDLTGRDGSGQRAIRLEIVLAIAETALAKKRPEFTESLFDFLLVEVPETEFLQAGRIDQCAVGVEMVERGMRRRMFAGIQRL